MIQSMSLENFRCFGAASVEFSRLNLFIGPNNAGKTTLLSAAELLLRSSQSSSRATPIDFENQAAEFASFASVLRKDWSKSQNKPSTFVVRSEWAKGMDVTDPEWWVRLEFQAAESDGSTQVKAAAYGEIRKGRSRGAVLELHRAQKAQALPFQASSGHDDHGVFFGGLFPFPHIRGVAKRVTDFLDVAWQEQWALRDWALAVIKPSRPMPRSLYVLDDPAMSSDDRGLVSFLVNLWTDESKQAEMAKGRIAANLKALGLASHIEVKRPVRGAKSIVRINVSTVTKRQLVTIADVGFGLSQVLPLVAREAALNKGVLVAYQPEVHLHPFAQSRLADIFASSLRRGNTVFVETHSQYMILRLQWLIASGKIRPADVKVFCVERSGNSSTVREMMFDELGRPSDPWPSGFLDTSLDIARDLATARVRGV